MKANAYVAGLLFTALAGAVAAQPTGNAGTPATTLGLACGGVGTDARDELARKAGNANLSLEMFIAQGGEYVADVDVQLIPVGSGTASLTLRTEGPICYLRVPPGRYRVEATYEGVKRSAQVTVAASPARPAHVALAFPKSVGDRQSDAASPEEKAQAARKP